jgi:hypothetical protein
MQQGSDRHFENIEVQGGHCGLDWNHEVLWLVADRLCQAPGQWQPMA